MSVWHGQQCPKCGAEILGRDPSLEAAEANMRLSAENYDLMNENLRLRRALQNILVTSFADPTDAIKDMIIKTLDGAP